MFSTEKKQHRRSKSLEMAMDLVSQIELDMNELPQENKKSDVNTKKKKSHRRSNSLELAKNLVFQIELELHPSALESNETKVNDCDDESIELLQENSPTDSVLFSRETPQDSIKAKFSSSDSCLYSMDRRITFPPPCLKEDIPSSSSSNQESMRRATFPLSCRQEESTSEFDMPSSSTSYNTSNGSTFRSLVSQLTERKSTSRHSEIEKGLMRQMEIIREEQATDKKLIEHKIRQRDDAIETMEMTLMIKEDTVDALRDKIILKDELMDNLRDELDQVKRKYRQEKQRRKSAEY